MPSCDNVLCSERTHLCMYLTTGNWRLDGFLVLHKGINKHMHLQPLLKWREKLVLTSKAFIHLLYLIHMSGTICLKNSFFPSLCFKQDTRSAKKLKHCRRNAGWWLSTEAWGFNTKNHSRARHQDQWVVLFPRCSHYSQNTAMNSHALFVGT